MTHRLNLKAFKVLSLAVVISLASMSSFASYGDVQEQKQVQELVKIQDNLVQAMTKSTAADIEKGQDLFIQAKENVQKNLKYPLSAKFKNMRMVATSSGVVVCGEVNAKDDSNLYVGFSHFISGGEVMLPWYVSQKYPNLTKAFNYAVIKYCVSTGLNGTI